MCRKKEAELENPLGSRSDHQLDAEIRMAIELSSESDSVYLSPSALEGLMSRPRRDKLMAAYCLGRLLSKRNIPFGDFLVRTYPMGQDIPCRYQA